MQNFEQKPNYKIDDLLEIVRLLRAPGGCPWDQKQDHVSLRGGFLEETYEVVDAIDRGSRKDLCEELGDVLLQVVFHAQLETEADGFDFDAVCDGICKKLIYRHPHVFDAKAQQDLPKNTAQVLDRWDQLKEAEKNIHTAAEDLDAVPAAMPALMRAKKLLKRAGRHGFTYPDALSAWEDLQEELQELRSEMELGSENKNRMAEEYGDVLLSLTNVGRLLDLDAEQALTDASCRFVQRLKCTENHFLEQGRTMKECSAKELCEAWNQAK